MDAAGTHTVRGIHTARETDAVRGLPTVRVFLLDDHEIVRRGVREVLSDAGGIEVVGEASTGPEAAALVPRLQPDVALLDARLEDGSGIDVCRDIRAACPEVGCLILTSYDDDDALFAAIMAGAAGYLLKQIRGTDLVGAIRTIAAGGSLLDPAVTARVLARFREGTDVGRVSAVLGTREREILVLIAEGLTNRQIAGRLHLSEKTVKNYVSSILDKLGLSSRTQAAVYAARRHA
ncbi:response regulator transcription factor [Frankia sp. Mgl5]|uniref:response regulator n=1 Tax=Frankia sp. Mgl5 TaxID=2933793 RepID=UPI00200FC26E|nr:response regulator transcription factor [Frankia sp. Mgl5]MCK9928085.1 response regulator transcription factor [Frankia sp. Mgl5]